MKAKVRHQLGWLQGRIEKRLEQENKGCNDDGRPVLRGTGAMYEIAERVRSVAAGGVALIHRMVQALGLDAAINERVQTRVRPEDRVRQGERGSGATERDKAYDSVRSVVQASRAIVDSFEKDSGGHPAFAWPVVVTGGPLLECWLDDDGEIQLEQVKSGLLAWRNRVLGFHSLVRVIQADAVQEFVTQAREDALAFLAVCRAAAN